MGEKIYIILRNGELYHGVKKKSKSVKAYTTRGMAEGVIKRDIPSLASEMYWKMDIRHKEVYETLLEEVEKQFSIKEVEI
jgi:hypothetical protein